MEKHTTLQEGLPIFKTAPQRSKRSRFFAIASVLVTSYCLNALQLRFNAWRLQLAVTEPEKEITFKEGNFTWTQCYEGYTCSTLEVPFDYHNPHSPKFNLSLIRLKSTKSLSNGPLFVNPGGPGGSGVEFVRRAGDVVLKLVGGEYDVIGFDPRGIGSSNTIKCFDDGAESKHYFANRPGFLAPDESIANFAIVQQALSHQCIERNRDFLPFVSTAAVARDIDSLRDAFGQELTNYIGFSYGTFLGAVYVNMFPDRVGRVMLDGVLDPSVYSDEIMTLIKTSLIHTEDGVDAFGEACEAAGPTKCALARSTDEKPYVAAAVRDFLDDLITQPLLAKNQSIPSFVTYVDAASALFSTLYGTSSWPAFADAFAQAIYDHDANAIVNAFSQKQTDLCPLVETYQLDYAPVLCLDSHHNDHQDLDSWMEGVGEAARVSPVAGPIFGTAMMRCLYWDVKAAERYTGPWNMSTKNKVLLVGATGDPVTPVENAQKLEQLMEGNGVFLKHEGWGHCSLGQPNQCTLQVIRKYFVEGVIPEKGTSCAAEYNPFDPPANLAEGEVSYEDIARAASLVKGFGV